MRKVVGDGKASSAGDGYCLLLRGGEGRLTSGLRSLLIWDVDAGTLHNGDNTWDGITLAVFGAVALLGLVNGVMLSPLPLLSVVRAVMLVAVLGEAVLEVVRVRWGQLQPGSGTALAPLYWCWPWADRVGFLAPLLVVEIDTHVSDIVAVVERGRGNKAVASDGREEGGRSQESGDDIDDLHLVGRGSSKMRSGLKLGWCVFEGRRSSEMDLICVLSGVEVGGGLT